ncbi:MAG TPA: division plane positioning ATPase MipZ [Chakrabartia sp.]|jgi:chromosome partitioning protein|nr:division plane positioning ATPase MipZ [Chakrabartia sp.]
MSGKPVHIVVFANEKGGTGKSTTAVHLAVALAQTHHAVGCIDLDHRQRTMARYLENREGTARRENTHLPTPAYTTLTHPAGAALEQEIARMAAISDFVIIDTPGRDDPMTRAAIARADTIVTPMNDSFVDLDLIGQVDADTYKVKRPSFYAELIWDLRKERGKRDGGTVDWVVMRNRMQHIEANNMRRVGKAMDELSKRTGFRVVPGLGERVIYRELFPKGLTLLDRDAIGGLGISHIAARQELRELVAALGLPTKDAAQAEFEFAQ